MKKLKTVPLLLLIASFIASPIVRAEVSNSQYAESNQGPTQVCTKSSQPSITLLSPNGGEIYSEGQSITMKWLSCGLPSSTPVQIILHLVEGYPGGTSYPLQQSGALTYVGAGEFTATLPIKGFGLPNNWYQMIYGKHYKVSIAQTQSPTNFFAKDESNETFTITSFTGLTTTKGGSVPEGSKENIVVMKDSGADVVATVPTVNIESKSSRQSTENSNNIKFSVVPFPNINQGPVVVSETSETLGVVMTEFVARADGADMKLQKLPITVTVRDTSSDKVKIRTGALVKSIYLYADGVKIDALSSGKYVGGGRNYETYQYMFGATSNLQYPIADGQQVHFEVRVDYNDLENSSDPLVDFDSGNLIRFVYLKKDLLGSVVQNVSTGDKVVNKTGVINGPVVTLVNADVPQIVMGSPTQTNQHDQNGGIVSSTLLIPYTVKNNGNDDIIIPLSLERNVLDTANNPNQTYKLFKDGNSTDISSQFQQNYIVTQVTANGAPSVQFENKYYARVNAGTQQQFQASVNLSYLNPVPPHTYRVNISNIDWRKLGGGSIYTVTPNWNSAWFMGGSPQ